jgi:hypothetical protein
MNFLMEVVVVLLYSCQLLLKFNLPSPQDILFVLGFFPLIQHVNQHMFTVVVSNGQPLNFKHLLVPFLRNLPQTLLNCIPLSSHLGQLSPQPFLLSRLRTGLTRC